MPASKSDTAVSGLQVFFVHIPEERLARLDARLSGEEGDSGFAEPSPAFKLSKNRAFVALVVDGGGQVIRAAVGHRGYSAGTDLSQVRLTDAVGVRSPFPLTGLPPLVKKRARSRVTSVTQ